MNNWFAFKGLTDKPDRLYGGTLRFCGVDFSIVLLGWVNEWKLIDLKIPANYGIYLCVGFITISIGRLSNDYFQVSQS